MAWAADAGLAKSAAAQWSALVRAFVLKGKESVAPAKDHDPPRAYAVRSGSLFREVTQKAETASACAMNAGLDLPTVCWLYRAVGGHRRPR